MDIGERVIVYGDIMFKTFKRDLKEEFDIKLDDDAEADWNEFWSDFVLSRVPDEDDEWDD